MTMQRLKSIHLTLNQDQSDDLLSALEAHRKEIAKIAANASNGFGLGGEYWNHRVTEIQDLIETVRRLLEESDIEIDRK